MEHYCCTCRTFNYEFILGKECSNWIDNVETMIEKHVSELEPIVSCKRWKMNKKKNQHQKIIMLI